MARRCGAAVAATACRQWPTTAGSMPMVSITSALRAIESARRWDAMAAVFASRSSPEVDSSLVSVRPSRTRAPPRAIQPIAGCRAKITAM